MSGMIPQSFIDDLLDRAPLAEVVRSRVDLKKSGSTLKACCPFHNEKTPSFNVNTRKNFYHCFGCGASGNAINFLREHDNLSFIEAVEELAKIAGVEVPRDERVQAQYTAQRGIQDSLDFACHQYRDALSGHKDKSIAKQYLEKRGLSSAIVERFAIGFAPGQKDFLWSHSGQSIRSALVKAKMVSDRYDSAYELFQSRLMFPIRNPRGRVVAFGGRTLIDDKAKYINSPESEVFHKSREIYGLYEAMQASRQLDTLLVVEGYMDVVSLAQYGIDYAVATLGTATNEENLSHLLTRCHNIVFCFDGDAAGLKAAKKAMENALPLIQDGMRISFLLLPDGEDPDTLVRKDGKEAFEKRIERAKPLSEFLFQIYASGLDMRQVESRGALKQKAEVQIEKVRAKVLKSALRQQLNGLVYQYKGRAGKKQGDSFQVSGVSGDLAGVKIVRELETVYCLAILYKPQMAEELLSDFDGGFHSDMAEDFARYALSVSASTTDELLYSLATDRKGARERYWRLFESLDWTPSPNEIDAELNEIRKRQKGEKKRSDALRFAKGNKLPSQMSDAEKNALRSISGSERS